jgi:hypothetical protein
MNLRFVILFCWLMVAVATTVAADKFSLITPQINWDADTKLQITTAQNLIGDIRRQAALQQTNLLAVDILKSKLNATVQSIPHAFALLQASTNGSRPAFQKITLNQSGLGFDGFRIKNTSTEPKKFAWACAFKANSLIETWHIVPVKGAMKGFSKYFVLPPDLQNVPWKNAGRPYKGFCQALDSAELQPGEEYIVWLSFTSTRLQEIYILFDLPSASLATNDMKEILKVLGVD